MKVGKIVLKVLAALLCVIVLVAIVIGGFRLYNGKKYTVLSQMSEAEIHETNENIVPIKGEYLNGLHFIPTQRLHKGTVVVYGGSAGTLPYKSAKLLWEQGYEVLALYFFGQDNQQPSLANVPLEQFNEVVAYIEANITDPKPITAIGSSKGAEFTALLAAHGYPMDNLVNYTPADRSYAGLRRAGPAEPASFTHQGQPVPFASLSGVSLATSAKLMWDFATGYPPSLRATYIEAAEAADDSSLIDLSGFEGNAIFFAGDQDATWQAGPAAERLAAQSTNFEAHIYPDAGHVFGEDMASNGTGWEILLGGTAEGCAAAYTDSNQVLLTRLAEWHGDHT